MNNLKDFELEIGNTKKVNVDKTATWTTSNSKVATVDKNGNVKAIGTGTATITATYTDKTKSTLKVTVVNSSKTTAVGKKDNTISGDSKLPQTGGNSITLPFLGITAVLLVSGVVFKKKMKY